LTLNADGTFIYTPDANFYGSDSFVYEVSDGNGGTAQATVNLTINPVNDAPIAADDAYTLTEDTTLTTTLGVDDLLMNDSDIDGDPLTVNTTPVSGPSNGTLTLNADGTFSYTPNPDYTGSDSFVYEVSDGNGGTAQATVDLTVYRENDPPVGGADSYTLVEDTPFTATLGVDDLLLNDTDIDGDSLTVTTTPVTGPSNGTLLLNADGTFTYTPDADFYGVDSFVYEINDGYGGFAQATATLTVNAVNDAPIAVDDTYTLNEDTPFSATLGTDDLLVNDIDVDGDTLTVNTTPLSGPSNGTLTLNADGSFTYTPEANFNGADSFVYEVSDGNGTTAQGVVTLTITPVNDNPTITSHASAANVALDLSENNNVVTTITGHDLDGNPLTFSLSGGSDQPLFSVDPTSGALSFNLPPDFETPVDSNADNVYAVTIAVGDGAGGSAQQSINVTVVDANDAPQIQDQAFVVDPSLASGDVVGQTNAFDQDAGDALLYAIIGGSGMPAFSIDDTTGLITASNALSIESAGQTMSLLVQVTDNAGTSATATVQVTVNAGSVDQPPSTESPGEESTDGGGSGSGTEASTETEADPAPESGTTAESTMADEAAASQAREQFDPSLSKHAFGGAATHFDDQPTEPSALGGMANSALERGIRAVVDILFDGGALDDANASAGSDGFGIEKVSFEVHLGRAGSGVANAYDFGSDELDADADGSQGTILRTATATGISLSVGFVAWALRTGALMAGLFAARPAWQGFDPLPVVKGDDEDTEEPSALSPTNYRPPDNDLLGERFDR
jgi:VCBS repeat-containing protein